MRTYSRKALLAALLLSLLLPAGIAAAATFDNDSKADVAIFRPGDGTWWIRQSTDGATAVYSFGAAMDNAVPGDYDGDGKADIAIFRPTDGTWWIRQSSDGSVAVFSFGAATDNAVPGDYDGDGKTDIAVFRPAGGSWWIRQSSDGSVVVHSFGAGTDRPVPGDYDGDGKTDVAIFRPGDGSWWIRQSSDGAVVVHSFGGGSDLAVPGDYDGDRKTDVAIFRPGDGSWWIRQSFDGSVAVFSFGGGTDRPAPGDYDGDGKTDIAVFRPTGGSWWIRQSSNGATNVVAWGSADDRPVMPAYSRSAPSGPFDIRDYFTLQLGDFSIRQDNSARMTLRIERFPDIPYPVYLERSFQQAGYLSDELWYFDSSDNTAKQYGYYEVSPYNGQSSRVLYRYVPPRTVGKTAMKVGDSFSSPYTIVNANSGDNVASATFDVTLAAVESVETPAGTFDNCLRYVGSDHWGDWTTWLCPRVGMVKEANAGGGGGVTYIRLADNTAYGTPPALAVSDLSGMFELDTALSPNFGGRWEKNLYSIVHDTANDNLAITRFRPNGNQGPRTGTMTGPEFTITGSTPSGPTTFQGVFTPDGRTMMGQWWFDGTPGSRYAAAAVLVSPVGRITGDEDVIWYESPTDNSYIRKAYTYPVSFSGNPNAFRSDEYGGMDVSAPLVGQSWWDRSWDGLYLIGEDNTSFPPMKLLPERFTFGQVYTTYPLGGGNARTVRVDQVGNVTVPLGNFALAQRINIQDNVGEVISNQYAWFCAGVPAQIKFQGPGWTDTLVSSRVAGAEAGNRPSTTPFPVLAGSYGFGNNISLRDHSDGTRGYAVQIGIRNPDLSQVTDFNAIDSITVVGWPSLTELPFADGSPYPWFSSFDYHAPPAPVATNAPSEYDGFLSAAVGSLLPGVYRAVIGDNTGQTQSAWLFYDTPTETGKVDNNVSTMYYAVNGDNSVTFNWATPSPAPDSAKHVIRLIVVSQDDLNLDGEPDTLFVAALSGNATNYRMPAASAAKLKGMTALEWFVEIREQASNIVNPDLTTANYFIYRNFGKRQSFFIP